MLAYFRPALVLLVLFTLVTGLAYPLAVTGVAQLVFPRQANGSLIEKDGVVLGSRLIGQNFVGARFFAPRPSATSAPDPQDAAKTIDAPYNAANSSGSNLGPTSKTLVERVAAAVKAKQEAGWALPVPVDAVTASASGLDPEISPANALAQVPAVAKARGLDEGRLRELVMRHIEKPWLDLIGEARLNVLALNLALDELK